MRRTERVAYRTKFYSNLSSPTRFDEEPIFDYFCLHNYFIRLLLDSGILIDHQTIQWIPWFSALLDQQ